VSDFHSSLPVFKTRSLGGGKLGVTCPRPDCGGKAVVRGKLWRTCRPGGTRSCTYCFRVAWISDARKSDFENRAQA
jgi:hypothetical protein